MVKIILIKFFLRIEYTKEDEDAILKAPEITEKREPLKTPKTYFFESLQKRRQRALTKSQSAARFIANAPNLIRRGSTIRYIYSLKDCPSKAEYSNYRYFCPPFTQKVNDSSP